MSYVEEPAEERIASALDDIATFLDRILRQLSRIADSLEKASADEATQ